LYNVMASIVYMYMYYIVVLHDIVQCHDSHIVVKKQSLLAHVQCHAIASMGGSVDSHPELSTGTGRVHAWPVGCRHTCTTGVPVALHGKRSPVTKAYRVTPWVPRMKAPSSGEALLPSPRYPELSLAALQLKVNRFSAALKPDLKPLLPSRIAPELCERR